MTRSGIALVSFVSLVAATVVTGFAISRAEATDGAQPNTSCATTTACIEGDNTSTGPGVKGTSTKGHGVVGTTKSKGTTSGTSHAGVLGQDLQTGGGTFNAGVEGTSINGTALLGTSTSGTAVVANSTNGFAISATSTNSFGVVSNGTIGVAGGGTVYGVLGGGPVEAVAAQNSTTGDAFLANGFGGPLFRGNNSQGFDVFVIDDGGNTSVGGTINAGGSIVGDQGVTGDSGAGVGVMGAGATEGVEGTSGTTGDALFANGFGGPLIRGNNSVGANVFEVDDGGNVFAISYNSLSDSTTFQPTSAGLTVKTYSAQVAQPTLEDDGEAQLVDGVAHVALDPKFASTIGGGYMVMVTPEGMTRGVLCVVERTMSGFVVQENMGGRSTVPFAYKIVAKPYGSTAPRLPLATAPGHFGRVTHKDRPHIHVYKPAHHAKPVTPHLSM